MDYSELKERVRRMLHTSTTYEHIDVVYNYIALWSRKNINQDLSDLYLEVQEKQREIDSNYFHPERYC